MPFLIFWSGSFAVQNGDHFRSGIICGPGLFAVRDYVRSWDHLRTRTLLLDVKFDFIRGHRLWPAKNNQAQKIVVLGSWKARRKTGNKWNGKCLVVVPFARARLVDINWIQCLPEISTSLSCLSFNKVKYLVQWKGYSPYEASWESEESILGRCVELFNWPSKCIHLQMCIHLY